MVRFFSSFLVDSSACFVFFFPAESAAQHSLTGNGA